MLEAGLVASAASGRNGGMCNNGFSQDYFALSTRLGRERANLLYRAFDAAVDQVEAIIAEERIDCDFKRVGKLKLAAKPARYDKLARSQALLAEQVDPDTRLVPRKEMRAEIGSDRYFGRLLFEKSAGMHVGKFGQGLAAAADPDELKLLLYTSGTTGRAKAVMHSHNTLTRAIDNGCEAWALKRDDIMLMPSPVTHITGFANGIELPFLTDTRSALMDQWQVDRAIAFIGRVGASVCISATPFLQELVQRAERLGTWVPSLRLFVCGGASVPPDLIYSAHRVLANCRACRAYGSTEAPLVTTGYLRHEDEYFAASTDGRIFDWDVQVRDDCDRVLSEGCDGEIVVRDAALMLGYRDDDQTREAFTDDGYFRTGDIGHMTPHGALVITDRKKDLIIRGGENLSPREIEDILHGHPDIQDAAVVAMPHDRLGEGVCAYLVVKPGCKPLGADALRPYLTEARLARQKWPERIEIRDSLKRTASGRVRKDLLRQDVRERLAR